MTSLVTAPEVINMLLDKFKVVNNPEDFAIYVVRDTGGICYPLLLLYRVIWLFFGLCMCVCALNSYSLYLILVLKFLYYLGNIVYVNSKHKYMTLSCSAAWELLIKIVNGLSAISAHG